MKCPLYRDARGIYFNSISAVSYDYAYLPPECQFTKLKSNPLHYKHSLLVFTVYLFPFQNGVYLAIYTLVCLDGDMDISTTD